MLETKDQKKTFGIIMLLIVVLGTISACSRNDFRYTDNSNKINQAEEVELARKYLNYLEAVKIDKEASKKLFETILTEDEIREEVKSALKTEQAFQIPEIAESEIILSGNNNKSSIESYLSKTVSGVADFNSKSFQANQSLFTEDYLSLKTAKSAYSELLATLKSAPVPTEAKNLHKSLLLSLEGYSQMLKSAEEYNVENADLNEQIWPEVYRAYAILNEGAKIYNSELNKLANKFQISDVLLQSSLATAGPEIKVPFVKTAHAFLGIGDVTITVGDIPRIIMDAVKEGLRSAFVQFLGTMLNKLLVKIEQNYMIANFLYYADALIAGQYTDDYLNKIGSGAPGLSAGSVCTQNSECASKICATVKQVTVTESQGTIQQGNTQNSAMRQCQGNAATGLMLSELDKRVIKRFIPQFSCGAGTAELRPVFEAKAKDFLGFEPQKISPQDPDYFVKMARVGNFLASPTGWRLYYEDLANQTKSEAEKAAERELQSPGLKTARSISANGIAKSLNNLVSAQRAGFTALLQLGAQNAEGIISSVVSQLTQTLVNNFVFKGVSEGPGSGVGVLKEQNTCVAVAQLQPIIPLDITSYQAPAPAPTEEDVYCQQNPADIRCP